MIEIAHWSALVPLAYVAAFRRGAPLAFWFVAVAFLCSFLGDTAAEILGGSWAAVPVYRIVQYAFFAFALLTPDALKLLPTIALYAVVGTALFYVMERHRMDPAPYPEFMRWWYPYQGVRLASFGLFVGAAWRSK